MSTRAAPSSVRYRSARPADLSGAAEVYVTATAQQQLPPTVQARFDTEAGRAVEAQAARDDLRAILDETPDQVWVAVAGERVIGVAAALIRERHWHLTYLFVLPTSQSRGIGRQLLSRVHQAGQTAGCDRFTLCSSNDPRALANYLQLGLAPGAPLIVFKAAAPVFPPVRWDDGLEAVPLVPDDPATLATAGDIDKAVRGCRRPADLQRWLAEGAVGALLTRRDTGAPAGYCLVSGSGPVGQIGPVAAMDEEWFGAVLGRALAAAGTTGHAAAIPWAVDVPGDNRAAIAPLFAAGFRPDRVVSFFRSAPIGQWDRYLCHDHDYL